MNAEKFTKKSLEVIENCSKLAYEYNNQEIDQEHLLLSMVTTDDCLISKMIEKMGIDFNQVPKEKEELLTGQTIGRSDIESFSSYKLMNDDEKTIVKSILNEMKTKDSSSVSMNGKILSKHIRHFSLI